MSILRDCEHFVSALRDCEHFRGLSRVSVVDMMTVVSVV